MPASEEGVRSLVIQRALEEAGTPEQIANRLAPFVHAAVGLSPERRRAIIDEVVLPALRQPEPNPRPTGRVRGSGSHSRPMARNSGCLRPRHWRPWRRRSTFPPTREAMMLARRMSSEAAERVARRLVLEVTDAGRQAGGV